MTDHEFPKAPEIEKAYRAAHRALATLVPTERAAHFADKNLSITELVLHLRSVVEEAEMTVAAQLGPLASWQAPRKEGDWDLIVAGLDLDGGGLGFGELANAQGLYEGPDGRWDGSAMDRAARAYRREARWDFSPGEAGLWVLMLAPESASGAADGDRPWFYGGHLVGFVILHDRDDDGDYESVAHIWTASAWRRRGIAARLLAEARARCAFTDIEGPYTEDGGAFLRAVGEADPR